MTFGLQVVSNHLFNVLHSEQDNGVHECNRSAWRDYREMPSILGDFSVSSCNVVSEAAQCWTSDSTGLIDKVLHVGVTMGSCCYCIHVHVLDSESHFFWNRQVTDVSAGSSRDALLGRASPKTSSLTSCDAVQKYLQVIVVLGKFELPGPNNCTISERDISKTSTCMYRDLRAE